MYQSIPLIYSGQEEPNKERLKFFVRDPIQWEKYELAPFYSTLLHLRKNDKALDADASYQKVISCNDVAIFSYLRVKDNNKVLVILNLSPQPQSFTIDDKNVFGKAKNVFSGISAKIDDNYVFQMEPWDYLVFEY